MLTAAVVDAAPADLAALKIVIPAQGLHVCPTALDRFKLLIVTVPVQALVAMNGNPNPMSDPAQTTPHYVTAGPEAQETVQSTLHAILLQITELRSDVVILGPIAGISDASFAAAYPTEVAVPLLLLAKRPQPVSIIAATPAQEPVALAPAFPTEVAAPLLLLAAPPRLVQITVEVPAREPALHAL